MRKIENEMLNAVLAKKAWSSGNTTVNLDCNACINVYLHGNRIAYQSSLYSPLLISASTLHQHPTRTTLSRLRALGFILTVSKGHIDVVKGVVTI